MVRACRKVKSKRMTCRKRFKIIKKVKEHHRKLRHEMKANPKKFTKKDPGIPNHLPFKEEVVKEAKEVNRKFTEVRRFNLLQLNKPEQTKKPKPQRTAEKCYAKQVSNVIAESDVILEVLDARDPLGTRCFEAEKMIKESGKRLVLIINKIDLVPRENLKLWLDYLRKNNVTLPFKANTQEQSKNLGHSKVKWNHKMFNSDKMFKYSQGLGVDGVISLLANYCRDRKVKTTASETDEKKKTAKGPSECLKVGVIGIPNTGKSSFVNTLKRSRVACSGNVPGLTKQSQMFQLDKNICLIDSPGIILSEKEDPCELLLRNCLRPEGVEDLTPAVEAILRRCSKRQLVIQYGLPSEDFSSTADFLVQLARRQGRIRKGGVADVRAASRTLVNDWITGKIIYCTTPPDDATTGGATCSLEGIYDQVNEKELLSKVRKLDYKQENAFQPVSELPASKPFLMSTLTAGGMTTNEEQHSMDLDMDSEDEDAENESTDDDDDDNDEEMDA